MKLFRAVSKAEKDDLERHVAFRTALNTLESKQFFKDKNAVKQYVRHAKQRDFYPPYEFIVEVEIKNVDMKNIKYEKLELDSSDAVNIPDNQLSSLSEKGKFKIYNIGDYI